MDIASVFVTDSELRFVSGDIAFDFDSWATLLNFLRQRGADAPGFILFVSVL